MSVRHLTQNVEETAYAPGRMFKRRSIRVPWLRVTGARMQNASVGRLPENLAEGDGSQQPAPEYIAEAAPPSEDAWAREQALYRAKNESDDHG
jgi:hypothetical protein